MADLKDKITKADFEKFLRLQSSGKINMTDIVMASKYCGLSEEIYEEIIFNYIELKEKFESIN